MNDSSTDKYGEPRDWQEVCEEYGINWTPTMFELKLDAEGKPVCKNGKPDEPIKHAPGGNGNGPTSNMFTTEAGLHQIESAKQNYIDYPHVWERKFIALDTQSFVHIDIDMKPNDMTEAVSTYLSNLKTKYAWYPSSTKEWGYHFIIPTNNDISSDIKKLHKLYHNGKELGEILHHGWGFIAQNTKIHNPRCLSSTKNTKLLNYFVKHFVKSSKKVQKAESKSNINKKYTKGDAYKGIVIPPWDKLTRMADKLDPAEHLTDYDSWRKVMMGLKCHGDEYEKFAIYLSKKVPDKYDEEQNDKLWKDMKINKNYDKYIQKLYNKQVGVEISGEKASELDCAKLWIKKYKNDYIVTKLSTNTQTTGIHHWNGVRWEQGDMAQNSIILSLMEVIKPILDKQEIKNSLGKFTSVTATSKIIERLLLDTKKEMLFEKPEHIFCFNNAVFDLSSEEQIEPEREHYMIHSTGFDYIKPTQELIDEMKQFTKEILPVNYEKIMTILATGLINKNFTNFLIMTGDGNNGKSVMCRFICAMLGDYATEVDNGTFQITNSNQAQSAIAKLKNARFAWGDEIKEMYVTQVKAIIGNTTVSARDLYEKSQKKAIRIPLTLAITVNQPPKFIGESDSAFEDKRLRNNDMKAKFVPNEEAKKEAQNDYEDEFIHLIKKEYSDSSYIDERRCALFHVMMPFAAKVIKNKITSVVESADMKAAKAKLLAGGDAVKYMLGTMFKTMQISLYERKCAEEKKNHRFTVRKIAEMMRRHSKYNEDDFTSRKSLSNRVRMLLKTQSPYQKRWDTYQGTGVLKAVTLVNDVEWAVQGECKIQIDSDEEPDDIM